MDPRLQRRVQRYGWDKAAALYEPFWRTQLEPAQRRMLELAGLQPGERVIDIASGTGLVTFRAASAVGPTGHVLATDLSEVMVARLTDEARARGVAQVSAARMDAESLDVPAATFDVALNALGLMYVPDPMAAARQMFRAVRPGGRLLALVWGRRSRCGWAEIFPIVDRRVASEVCPMFFQLGTGDVLAETLRGVGAVDVVVERLSVPLTYASDEEACGAAFAGGPVALAYSRFDEPTRAEAEAEYLASIAGYRTADGYEIPGEFVIASGRRPTAQAGAVSS